MPDLHRALDPVEQRVLGCLAEKEMSTPDAYPLSGNSLLAACNQTTNRDPVLALTAGQVEGALQTLMADLLVWRERGARVLRWKHQLDEKLRLDSAGKAILAELLLRGAQTPGELRGRSHRLHAFGGLGEVEGVLTELAARGLVAELPRQPGQKERRWRHLLGQRRGTTAGGGGGAAAEEPAERHLRVGPQQAQPRIAEGGGPAEARPGAAPAPDRGGREAAIADVARAAGPSPPAFGSARPAGMAAAPPGVGAAAATTPAQLALERRVTQLEQRLAEVLARLARVEERS
jgi:uncharacterized protein YceH (UPF0502 family)